MEEKYESGDSNLIEHLNRIISILEDVIGIRKNIDKSTEILELALNIYQNTLSFKN